MGAAEDVGRRAQCCRVAAHAPAGRIPPASVPPRQERRTCACERLMTASSAAAAVLRVRPLREAAGVLIALARSHTSVVDQDVALFAECICI
jgi:hypothetical protein